MNLKRLSIQSNQRPKPLVLPLPHQSEVQTEHRHGGEIVARDCLLPAEAGGDGAHCRYNPLPGARGMEEAAEAGGGIGEISFPNSFSSMAEITPHHYESRCGNTRDVREPEEL